MATVKFVHGGKEYTFTEATAVTDLANLMCKELFGITFHELSARLINFTFEYNGEECYFSPSFVVAHLKKDQMKADVKNMIQDMSEFTEIFGFNECPDCNVVYPNTKVEHCRKCGYTPPGLKELKRKLMAGEPVEMPNVGADTDGGGVQPEATPPEGSDEAGDVLQGSGSVPE